MKIPCQVKALYEYTSEHSDDLNFPAGQIISVEAVEDDEWLRGSCYHETGKKLTGIFPKGFVEVLDTILQNEDPASTIPLESPTASEPRPQSSTSLSPPNDIPELRIASDEKCQVEFDEDAPGGKSSAVRSSTEVESISEHVQRSIILPQGVAPGPEPKSITTEGRKNDKPISASVATRTSEEGKSDGPISPAPSAPAAPSSSEKAEAKPMKSNAFRDRIAAFNKKEASPIAPKPMAKPSFAKKPFVAPPPSRDAFVQPPTQTKPKTVQSVTTSRDVVNAMEPDQHEHDASYDEPPKIGSLKDRIAALQAERAQNAAKKTTPTDEPVRSVQENQAQDLGPSEMHRSGAADSTTDEPAVIIADQELSQNRLPPTVPSMARPQDDILPAQESENVQPLERWDSTRSFESQRSRTEVPVTPSVLHAPVQSLIETAEKEPEHETLLPDTGVSGHPAASHSESEVPEEAAEEEVIDPAELRKQQLRERMAKMSGGMGMGMHMALGLPSSKPAKPTKTASMPVQQSEVRPEQQYSPIPMPGMQSTAPHRATESAGDDDLSIDSPVNISTSPSRDVNIVRTDASSLASPPSIPAIRPPAGRQASADSIEQLQAKVSAIFIVPGSAPSSSTPILSPEINPPSRQIPQRPVVQESEEAVAPVAYAVPSIPAGRPAEQRPLPPAIPPNRPPAPRQSSASSMQSVTQGARTSLDQARGLPPPVPVAILPTGPLVSPGISRDSSSTPSNTTSKRMSYFGSGSPPLPASRPSIDSNIRSSMDLSRSSFDALSRADSLRSQPPSRPPPPSVPANRAPPPPVPSVNSPPTRPLAPPQAPNLGLRSEDVTFAPALPSASGELSPKLERLDQPRKLDTEREGYEADDDDTVSMNRPSISESVDREGVGISGFSSPGERAPSKKKGIKGIFKRKDKDAKAV